MRDAVAVYTAAVSPQISDHLFVFIFVLVYPVAGVFGFRRLLRRIDAGHPVDRLNVYRNTMMSHWALLVVALLIWSAAGRDWSALGLYRTGDRGWTLWVAAAFVAAVIVILLLQLRRLAGADERSIARLYRRLSKLEAVVPATRAELRRFYAVSATAGIVEEVLWRGFLIWYLSRFWPLGIAALVSTIAFGIAHAYQGWRQVPSVTAVGAALTALYLLTGTLWMSIALHIAIDVLQGKLGFEITRRQSHRSGLRML